MVLIEFVIMGEYRSVRVRPGKNVSSFFLYSTSIDCNYAGIIGAGGVVTRLSG